MGFVQLLTALVRPILFFLTSLVWRIIIGVLLISAGIIYGMASHQVTYHHVPQGHYELLFADDGTYYLHLQGDQTYYIIRIADFTQMPDATVFNSDQGFTSLIYQNVPEQAQITLDGKTHTVTGYQLVQLAVPATDQHPAESFVTSEYEQHPDGFYDNRWLGAGIIWGIALLFLALSSLAPRILKKNARAHTTSFQNHTPSFQDYSSFQDHPSFHDHSSMFQDPTTSFHDHSSSFEEGEGSAMEEVASDWNQAASATGGLVPEGDQAASATGELPSDEDQAAFPMEEIALREGSADITTKRLATHNIPKRPTPRKLSSQKLSKSRLRTY